MSRPNMRQRGREAPVELTRPNRYQTVMSSTVVLAANATGTALPARKLRALRIWLGALATLIVVMILVGGATRLTESGLSITEWKPVLGAIPPLTEAEWHEAFEAYKQIPQYTEVNRGMSLEDFKTIYWWEWTHRFLGRLIGAVFLLPFLALWIAGYIPRTLLPRLLGLFLLGGIQGAIGWYMVMSGLVDRVSVSQYRLMAHFGIALVILAYTLWLLFGLGRERARFAASPASAWIAWGVLALIFVQMLAGALVAGLDAGLGFNTWPLINGAFGQNNLAGNLIQPGIGQPSPRLLTVVRRMPDGCQVPILVDLHRALVDPSERILVQAGDVLVLQETPCQAMVRYFTQNFEFTGIFTLFRHRDALGAAAVVAP